MRLQRSGSGMPADLSAARRLAEDLRFAGDIPSGDFGGESHVDHVRAIAAQQALQLNGEVAPTLWPAWVTVCRRLEVPPDRASAFVYADPMPRADVFADSFEHCIVRFSSGLVRLLDEREFMFVAAHELGHYLLGHSRLQRTEEPGDLEQYLLQRAAEISVDRLGLLGCESVEVSMRAMMKLIAGLDEAHLRFDVAAFIRQISERDRVGVASDVSATHPSIVVRTRSLLWSSMAGVQHGTNRHAFLGAKATLDGRVASDLQRFVDGPVLERIDDAKTSLAMWMTALRIARHGSFAKDDQERFRLAFGEERFAKFRGFVGGHSQGELTAAASGRVREAEVRLREMIPRGANARIAECEQIAMQFATTT